jgi:hypothetical protein
MARLCGISHYKRLLTPTHLHQIGLNRPAPPGLDRVAMAEAEPGAVGPAGPDLPGPAGTRCSPSRPPGFGVGTSSAWRYLEETVALLAARAPNRSLQ